jgi:hypothetical protein
MKSNQEKLRWTKDGGALSGRKKFFRPFCSIYYTLDFELGIMEEIRDED